MATTRDENRKEGNSGNFIYLFIIIIFVQWREDWYLWCGATFLYPGLDTCLKLNR